MNSIKVITSDVHITISNFYVIDHHYNSNMIEYSKFIVSLKENYVTLDRFFPAKEIIHLKLYGVPKRPSLYNRVLCRCSSPLRWIKKIMKIF